MYFVLSSSKKVLRKIMLIRNGCDFSHAVSVAFGLSASIIFIVVQIVILVDFAHGWAENW